MGITFGDADASVTLVYKDPLAADVISIGDMIALKYTKVDNKRFIGFSLNYNDTLEYTEDLHRWFNHLLDNIHPKYYKKYEDKGIYECLNIQK